MFSNRTLHPTRRILCNVCIYVGAFVYLVDFHIIEIPLNSSCLVIFGNHFYNSMNIDIDNKKQALSLHLGEETVEINYNQFMRLPYEKKVEIKEEKTIAELAAIYFCPPQSELQRSLTSDDSLVNDSAK